MFLQTKKNLNVYRICRMFWSKIRLGITPHGNNRNKDFCVSLSLIKRIRDQRREFNSTVVVTNKQVQILRTVLLHPRWHRFEGDVYFDLVFYFYFLILFLKLTSEWFKEYNVLCKLTLIIYIGKTGCNTSILFSSSKFTF